MVANWLVDEMNASTDAMQKWRREVRPAAQVYGGLCAAPFHFRHFDELLEDIDRCDEAKPREPAGRAIYSFGRARMPTDNSDFSTTVSRKLLL